MENVVLLILITKMVIKSKNIYMRSIYFEFEWRYNFITKIVIKIKGD